MTTPLFPDEPPGPPPGAPLAERMRPRRLAEVVGQDALVGPGSFLARAVAARRLPSLILWGPPGSGKTTIARLLAREVGADFFPLSAVSAGVKDVREVVATARKLRKAKRQALVFIDEIHRFHRGQQDALLPHVEDGTIVLLGATTENPGHSVVAPLLSRCRVLVLEPLSETALETILRAALEDDERGLAGKAEAGAPVIAAIAADADSDARRALSTLEIAARLAWERGGPELPVSIEVDDVRLAAQRRILRADRAGDAHYDLASAFIKSMRGSDPDAAVYYLMRGIESGEDPRFLARRMLIFAAEDIGLADPRALSIALAAAEAFERLGLPEGSLPLTEAALYLSCAPKSDTVIRTRDAAWAAAREAGSLEVPAELRDAHGRVSRELGHGRGYRYPHDEPGHHAAVEYLPEALRDGTRFFEPTEQGEEAALSARLSGWRAAVRKSRDEE